MRLPTLLAGAMLLLAAAPASADRLRDHVEADSYGNLVVSSRAGYKRIVVGQGHLAGELREYNRQGEAKVVYGTNEDATYRDDAGNIQYRDCYRPPVLVHGRSYMYGLADGELPIPAGTCHPQGR
ncbi:MAG: hypothetical protein DI629_17095 [Mesorhizobium amorphae]|nr:MAG: hypothetical protein DI629_17095 [Mesorhizobium amorphae]